MLHNKQWVYCKVEDKDIEKTAAEAGISKLLARVFLSRGIHDPAYIGRFLNPLLEDLYDPFLLNDMDRAVERIGKALRDKEKIVVYGDYDVDGVTSTSILYDFLQSLGANVSFYIPDRLDEGYGLSLGAIDRVRQMEASLIITVDCGITAFEEVDYIIGNQIDIIITDHHECMDTLPSACAVINPCRHDSTYPFKELAGVGVAFKLVNALCIRMNLGNLYLKYLDLVALGTVADVVPLVEENRIIVKHGLPCIENTSNTGLKALIENSGLKDKPVNSFSLSFGLAPRVNAAGRLGDAGRAVRLFTTKDGTEASNIASELNEANKYRQDTEQEILRQVVDLIEGDEALQKDSILVVSGQDWHHGVIGIVASKITEKYYRPCILISDEDGMGKGSGRSIEGFNLFEALCFCGDLLEKFGGHELAAGLTLQMDKLEEFRRMINSYAASVLSEEDLIPRLRIDALIGAEDINLNNVSELERLAPFGAGNPGPVFACSRLKVCDIRTVGEDRHLKLKLEGDGFFTDAIGFNMGSLAKTFNYRDILDVVFSLEINVWNSTRRIQFNLKDIKPNDEIIKWNRYLCDLDKSIEFKDSNDYNRDNDVLKKIETVAAKLSGPTDSASGRETVFGTLVDALVPERQDLVAVYQYIKAKGGCSLLIDDLFVFARRIAESYRISMNYFKAKKSIEIFHELKLLKAEPAGEYGMSITLTDSAKEKTNLENSKLYRHLQSIKKHLQFYND